jgi:hypothetical protein
VSPLGNRSIARIAIIDERACNEIDCRLSVRSDHATTKQTLVTRDRRGESEIKIKGGREREREREGERERVRSSLS